MFASGIVVLSFPFKNISRLSAYLKKASRFVDNVLYVKFESNAKCVSLPAIDGVPKYDLIKVVPNVYRMVSSAIPSIDVRILLNQHYSTNCGLGLSSKPEVLFTDCDLNGKDRDFWMNYASSRFNLNLKEIKFLDKIENESSDGQQPMEDNVEKSDVKVFDKVCIGGTFDGLHNGHKVLLSEAILRCKKELTIGVTDETMIKKKTLFELIAPVEERIRNLRLYLQEVDNSIKYNIVSISDPLGPAVVDASLECIVVSDETTSGGNKINEIRQSKHMKPLDLIAVNLVQESDKQSNVEEDKISSSSGRIRKLGTLLKKPERRLNLPNRPYLIGVTGGIASGKTHLCDKLESLGAGVINCDLLAHQTYRDVKSGAYKAIVELFGKSILNEDNSIDRRKLGTIVFADREKLKQLNDIVWPATAALADERINELKKTHEVIVLEAAVLLEANWEFKVHEVWVSIIPEQEAVLRLKSRNSFDEEEAKKRIASQLTNTERVRRANVVFSSLWDYSFTEKQVDKAWNLLMTRIKDKDETL